MADETDKRGAAEKELAALKAATGPAHSCSLLAAQLIAVEKERDEARLQLERAHPEFGELRRLQEELEDEKVENRKHCEAWKRELGEGGRLRAELERARVEAAAMRAALAELKALGARGGGPADAACELEWSGGPFAGRDRLRAERDRLRALLERAEPPVIAGYVRHPDNKEYAAVLADIRKELGK